ncbi:CynX/NimT family MFS transporter [Chromobacterium sp. IIBBL 290-4]|uniref:MFS transporter n=1 Tax=Chromobacterium sp. IIBBL 290-4 TaxID=2953890 RepID=UPI0020B72DCF|nr:MFS transporter [Chromobacterium sp. IIBBL 290-4]UTH73067.1 MFS transporter [Chromobacterium sp. IIBBL 290-4]
MKTNKYAVEGQLFVSYVLFAMCWAGGSAFIPQIMREMGIHDLAAGSHISNAVAAAKLLGSFIAAAILSRLLARKSIALAMGLMAIGILTPFIHNYPLLLLVRFLMGLGGALLVVYFAPIVMLWFKPRELALVNGINSGAFNIGTAIVLFGLPIMQHWFGGWQNTLLAISLGSVLCFVLWLAFGAEGVVAQQHAGPRQTLRQGLAEPFNWLLAFTYCGTLSFYVMMFTFYANAGIAEAKFITLGGLGGTIAGTWLTKRTQRRLIVLRVSGLFQLLAIIGLHAQAWHWTENGNLITAAALAAGFFIYLPMPSLITLAQEQPGMTPDKVSVTFSLFWFLSYLAATIAPYIFGLLVDAQGGDYSLAMAFATLASSTFLIGSLLLREKREPAARQAAQSA